MPETIVSRCQVIKFYPLADKLIAEELTKRKINQAKIKEILALSQGANKLAIDLAEDDTLYQKRLEFYQQAFKIFIARDFYQQKTALEKLITNNQKNSTGFNLIGFLETILIDLIYLKNQLAQLVINQPLEQELSKLSNKVSLKQIIIMFKQLNRIKDYQHRNLNLNWALENFFLTFNLNI